MKTNYYLIDTENVGDRWMDFIDEMQEEDVLVVFYSRNHSKMLEETYLKQRYNKKIRWIECLTGSNALDHQLMGVLSYLVATYTDATYSICSNDKDYQNVIDFWEQRGVEIGTVGFDTSRKGCRWHKIELAEEQSGQSEGRKPISEGAAGNEHGIPFRMLEGGSGNSQSGQGKALDKVVEDSPVSQVKGAGSGRTARIRAAAAASEKRAGQILREKVPDENTEDIQELSQAAQTIDNMTEEQIVAEIARSIPVSNLGNWYTVLVSLLGQDTGLEYYRKLKKDEAWRAELSRYLLKDAHERNVYLIALLYKYHHLDAAKAAEAYKLVNAHNRKNKKAIHADFEKHFGKKTEEQNRYYKVVKPVVDVLKGK